MGWHTPELTTAQTRLQGVAVWEILFFLLNAFLFTMVGLQLPVILDGLAGYSTATLLWYAVLVAATVVGGTLCVDLRDGAAAKPSGRRKAPAPWQPSVVLAWSGMRGAVSLAAALALPLTTDAGTAFPNRELIVFLTFSVILVTVVVQGLSLPKLIDVLELEDDSRARGQGGDEGANSRRRRRPRPPGGARRRRVGSRGHGRPATRLCMASAALASKPSYDERTTGPIEQRSTDYQRLLRELIEAERAAVRALRRERRISDEVMRRVERDLDLEEARLE